MKKIILLLFYAFLCLQISAVYAQKAYDTIIYKGKNSQFALELTLADGYIEASKLAVSNPKTQDKKVYAVTIDDTQELLILWFGQPTQKKEQSPIPTYFLWEWAAVGEIPDKMVLKFSNGGKLKKMVLYKE
ncbi:MAG: hypothetical protein JNM36_12765 [Chitinophagales bacterium]|nr:hypothetical protein [Chitinophagales bacterium]